MLKVVAFVRAVREFIEDGCHVVTREQYAERLTICQGCENRNGMACGLCGCWLALKARGRAWNCPDDPPRWPVIRE